MRTFEEMKEIISFCRYPDFDLLVREDAGGRAYLQVSCPNGTCNVTGEPLSWRGAKQFLSPHMCKNELVSVAFKAIREAIDHETKERFTYRGLRIFDPHIDPELLVELMNRKDVLNTRESETIMG